MVSGPTSNRINWFWRVGVLNALCPETLKMCPLRLYMSDARGENWTGKFSFLSTRIEAWTLKRSSKNFFVSWTNPPYSKSERSTNSALRSADPFAKVSPALTSVSAKIVPNDCGSYRLKLAPTSTSNHGQSKLYWPSTCCKFDLSVNLEPLWRSALLMISFLSESNLCVPEAIQPFSWAVSAACSCAIWTSAAVASSSKSSVIIFNVSKYAPKYSPT